MALQPKLTTKSGMPSGTTTSTAHMRPAGEIGALDEPGQGGAHDGAEGGDHHGEADRVPQELRRQAAEEQRLQGGPPGLEGLDDQEDQRRHHRQGDEHRRREEQRRAGAMVPGQMVVVHVVAQPLPPVVPRRVAAVPAMAAPWRWPCPWACRLPSGSPGPSPGALGGAAALLTVTRPRGS